VLSESRTEAGIRDALRAGRVCVRSPSACSLEVRAPGGAWFGVGGALAARGAVEARATGEEVEIVVNGKAVATPDSNTPAAVALDPAACSVVRARVDEGFSAPIYVNCPFAAN
jgi:hypothetical protein